MSEAIKEYLEAQKEETARPLTDIMSKRKPDMQHLRPKDPLFRVHVPPDYHADALGDDNGTIARAKGRNALDALWNVHTKLNETALAVQDRAKLASQVEPIALKAMRQMREEIAGLNRQHDHAVNELRTALGNGVGMLQAEVRSIMRDMKSAGDRLAFCRELIANKDIDNLKAIAAVSPALSGLDPETYAWVKDETERLLNPKAHAEREECIRARAKCEAALEDFDRNMAGNLARWRSSDDQRIANLVSSLTPKETT